jgi:hypothetical protein
MVARYRADMGSCATLLFHSGGNHLVFMAVRSVHLENVANTQVRSASGFERNLEGLPPIVLQGSRFGGARCCSQRICGRSPDI